MLRALPRNPLQVAREVANELCWLNEVVIVVDLATPYLEESWVDAELLRAVVTELSRCVPTRVLLGTLVGNPLDALPKLSIPRTAVVELESFEMKRVSMRAYRRRVEARVARLGRALSISIPRTNPYPPILGSVAILATYATTPSDRWAIYADPKRVDENIALAYLACCREPLAILDASKSIECDGPIHGCVQELASLVLAGSPIEVDYALSLATRQRLRYLDYLLRVSSTLHPAPISAHPLRRIKVHSLSRTLVKGVEGTRR